MGKYLDLVKKYIDKGCKDNGAMGNLKHFERTLYWILQLKPNSDEALLIAAYSHDAERVFKSNEYSSVHNTVKGFKDADHLKYHQDTGAKIVSTFLLEKGAPHQMAKKVSFLISKHEIGGNSEQELLKDADSISFFETNVEFFLTKQVEKMGKDKVNEKFDWMFNRITSPKAKAIAKPWYQEAIKKLK